MARITLWLGPIAALAAGLAVLYAAELSGPAAWTAAVAVLCAVWWVAEPVPIPATSLLPIALFPLVGVLDATQVGAAVGHKLILLLMGGLILSKGLERSGVHRRLALGMVRLCSGAWRTEGAAAPTVSRKRLVLGFAVASAALSMWVSNTATTLMLLPIAGATLQEGRDPRLRLALLLGIAYAASLGGVGTPIGTPPNLLCLQAYAEQTGAEPTFLTWTGWGLPVTLAMLPFVVLWLTRGLGGPAPIDLPEAGPWRPAEVRTLAVFGVTALLWVTRKAWSDYLQLEHANDASVALPACVVMFALPSGEPPEEANGPAPRLLDWPTAATIPWGMLLLFSGGMVLATAFKESGLSTALGAQLTGLTALPTPLLIGAVCLAVTFLTEVTSNTATTALLMPILGAAATGAGIDPGLLLFPAAASASFAFMLPVATAPNAIVYGAGVTAREMAREGLVLNLIGAVVVTILATLLLG